MEGCSQMSRSTVVALLSALLIWGCLGWAPFGLLVKGLVDLVALGHSLAKTLLLLLFILVLSLLVKRKGSVSDVWTRRFALLLPVLFLANLIQYLWYCNKFGIAPIGWSAVVEGGYWTMSRLDHTHTAKAMLSPLPGWLATRTDVGHSLGALFPKPLLWLQLVLFLLVIALAGFTSVHQLKNDTPGRATSYVLASFVLVKCLVDGGLLIPEVWAAVPVFSYLVFGRDGLKMGTSLSLVYAGSLFFWKPGAPAIVLLDWLPALVALFVPVVWERSKSLSLALLLLVLTTPFIRYYAVPSSRFRPHALNTAAYSYESLKQGWRVYIASPRRLPRAGLLDIESEVMASQTGFYLTQGTLTADTTPMELCRTFGLEVVRRPISWYHGPVQVESRTVVLKGSLDAVADSPLVTSFQQEQDKVSVLFRPGVNRDLAMAALGSGLVVLHDFRLSYPKAGR